MLQVFPIELLCNSVSYSNVHASYYDHAVKWVTVNIYIRFENLESPMLHANFQIIYSQFWRRSFVKGFTIYGDGGHLGHVTMTI